MAGYPGIYDLRDRIVTGFGPEWAGLVELVARLRTGKLTSSDENVYCYKVLADLLGAGRAELLAQGKHGEIDHLLTRVCDRDITLAGLGLTLPDCTP